MVHLRNTAVHQTVQDRERFKSAKDSRDRWIRNGGHATSDGKGLGAIDKAPNAFAGCSLHHRSSSMALGDAERIWTERCHAIER